MASKTGGCILIYKLGEDNFRITLLFMFILLYMLCGMIVFR